VIVKRRILLFVAKPLTRELSLPCFIPFAYGTKRFTFKAVNFGLFCDELINAISTFDNNCDLNISCIDAKI